MGGFFIGAASTLLKAGGIAKRLRPPSEKRAASVAPGLVAAANAGNLTAARCIAERTTFGIMKERAVWQQALAQLRPEIVAAARAARNIPAIDHSTPESAASFALTHPVFGVNGTSSAVPTTTIQRGTSGTQAKAPAKAPRSSSRAGQARPLSQGLEEAEAYQGRQQKRYEKATGARWASRYDPLTGLKWRIPDTDERFDLWPSRKPSNRARRAQRRGTAKAGRVVEQAVSSAVKQYGGAAVTGVALAGIAAYLATTAVRDGAAESDTIANAVAKYRSIAATEFQRRFGRRPTVTEYRELRADIGAEIEQALRAESPNPLASIPARWRNFISLFKRG